MKYNNQNITRCGWRPTDENPLERCVEIIWDIIDVCNYKCTYCSVGYWDERKSKQSTFFKYKSMRNVWRQIIERLKLNAVPDFAVDLLGGEPTLHPDIIEIISELNKNSRCKSIQLTSNMTKPVSFFKKLIGTDITLVPSIHFEQAPDNLLQKILSVNNLDIDMRPSVMMHPDKRFWKKMKQYLNTFIDADINFDIALLNPNGADKLDTDITRVTEEHGYSEEFYTTFEKYLTVDLPNSTKIPIETCTEKALVTNTYIYKNNVMNFKGWKCTPKSWRISANGMIRNDCTFETLNVTGSNFVKQVKCPLTKCKCKHRWNYEKYK